MFRIKICGITNIEDAVAAVDAGADALGLNFYAKSPRSIGHDVAKQIAAATDVVRIGVFVNQSPEEMRLAWNSGQLAFAQIHGDETPEMLTPIAEMGIITVHRIAPSEVEVLARLERSRAEYVTAMGRPPGAMLVDSAAPGEYGGTGTKANWQLLRDHQRRLGPGAKLILAGGLTPENVGEAIAMVRPVAVDVASGVESSPGKKDPRKVRDFIAAAAAAFKLLGD